MGTPCTLPVQSSACGLIPLWHRPYKYPATTYNIVLKRVSKYIVEQINHGVS